MTSRTNANKDQDETPRENPRGCREDARDDGATPPMPTAWDGYGEAHRGSLSVVRASLSPVGARALDVAVASIASAPDPNLFAEAAIRYARAVDLADELRREWIDHGRPKLYTVNNGTLVPHPLIKMLREAESDAAKFGRALKLEPAAVKRASGGRPQGATTAKDRVGALGPVIEVNAEEDEA